MIQFPESWEDDGPFCLLIVHYPEPNQSVPTLIDIGKRGWATEHADLMRVAPAKWYLVSKERKQAVFGLVVNPGEQPFCVKRHVGILGASIFEVAAFGLGKKRPDGIEQSIWMLPSGMVASGDDVRELGIDLVYQMVSR